MARLLAGGSSGRGVAARLVVLPGAGLDIFRRCAPRWLVDGGITVGRSFVGEWCTSLGMAGVSLVLVGFGGEIEDLLAARVRSRWVSSDGE